MRPIIGLVLAAVLVVVLTSCQTTHSPDDLALSELPVTPPTPEEFAPAAFLAPLALAQGRYPTLLTPESYALWLGPEMAALKRAHAVEQGETIPPIVDAAVNHINNNFLIIECCMSSAFADMSIGYDAVGLRGMSAYLLFPNGCKIEPVQIIRDSSVEETQVGAIKKFTRSNFVVFERRNIAAGHPTVAPDMRAVRLVLEGYGNSYYFEWASLTAPVTPLQPSVDEKLKAVKCGFMNTYGRIVEFLHAFD